ncbi:MAG: hypothetical protein RLZZ196_512 [Bacteroidota bacterium]|jgi:uncharacterized membrane protein
MPLVKRHIAKSISYRFIGTFTTIILTVCAGLPIKWAGMVGLGELIIKPIIYFLHERFWYKWIKFGLKKEN